MKNEIGYQRKDGNLNMLTQIIRIVRINLYNQLIIWIRIIVYKVVSKKNCKEGKGETAGLAELLLSLLEIVT